MNKQNIGGIHGGAHQRRAFTLVEVIISIAVFAMLLLVLIGLSQQVHQFATISSRKTTAATIAQEQIEIIRNLPFDQVGSEVTYPTGPLASTQTITRNGGKFTITIAINYLDDPADGVAPADTVPADYKQVEVRVCWDTGSCGRPVRLTTLVVPKTLEYSTNAGALFVTVVDANGQPVSGATISVTNSSPAVNVVNQTDGAGKLQLLNLPAATNSYHVTATKNGYSSDATLASSVSNPNPSNPDTSIVTSQITNVTLYIDHVGSLLVKSLDQATCAGLAPISVRITGQRLVGTNPNVPAYDQSFTTDATGQFLVSNLPWDNYTMTVSSQNDDVAGVTPPDSIKLNPGSSITASIVFSPHQSNTARIIVRQAGTLAPITNALVTINNGGAYSSSLTTDQGILEQNTWVGGPGQATYGDLTKFSAVSGGIDTSADNQLSIAAIATPDSVSENFHTTNKRDSGATTADWNTSTNVLQLPPDPIVPGVYDLTGVGQSTTLNTVTGKITSVTLIPTETLNGQTILYEVTADGSTFETVTPGVAHTMAATGSDLRWRITLTSTDTSKTPTISSLNIQYSQLLRPDTSGTVTSSTFDNGSPTNYTTLSWEPTSQPPSAGSSAVRFQVATAGTTITSGNPTVDASSDPTGGTLFTKNIGDANNTTVLAQSFISGANDTVDSIDVKIAQHSSPTTIITAFIYTDVSGQPGANISGSGQDLTATLPSDSSGTWQNSWTTQTFAPHTALVSGTKYWLVLQVSGSNSVKYWTTVRSNTDTTYASGTALVGAAINSLTNLCVSGCDIAFQIRRSGQNETPNTPTNFIGPDGTSASYYTVSGSSIHSSLSGFRYLRYRLFLHTDDPLVTPTINRISIIKNNACTPPGQVFFSPLPNTGSYTVVVTADGYETASSPITVNGNTTQYVDMTPTP